MSERDRGHRMLEKILDIVAQANEMGLDIPMGSPAMRMAGEAGWVLASHERTTQGESVKDARGTGDQSSDTH